jgi:hypothetical protein
MIIAEFGRITAQGSLAPVINSGRTHGLPESGIRDHRARQEIGLITEFRRRPDAWVAHPTACGFCYVSPSREHSARISHPGV